MAKKLDLNKLTLGIKKDLKKDNVTVIGDIDSVVRKIHENPANEKKIKAQNELTRRTTLDIPRSLHKKICQRALDKNSTIKDYLLDLAKNDIGVE